LMGGRLKYTPAGARGFLCVAVSTSERRLPDFTLPALTGSGGARLGRQMAVAGARLMPSATESTIPSLLSDSQKGAEAGLDEGFGGVTRALMSDGEERSFLGDGVLTFALGLWGTCLSLYTKGSAKLENAVSGLPLGLDSLMSACLRKLGDVAQISAPDLRRPQPTLVDTADIGDAGAAGAEGAFVRALSGAKSGLERLGGASAAGFREAIRAAVNELDSDVSAHVDKLMNITVLGVQIPLPFSESVQTLCGRAFEVLRNKEEELFAMLGVGAW